MNKENKTWDKFQMQTVEGKTVAFIGVGDIAQHSARGLQSLFHMKINILKRSKPRNDFKLPEIEAKKWYYYAKSEENYNNVYENADYAICSLQRTTETVDFLGENNVD